jgi:hypothetical protein
MAVAARQLHTQQEHYFRASVTYATVGIGTAGTVPLGTLPAGAIVTSCIVKVTEAFNAATTNVLTVGTAADDDAVMVAGDVNEAAIGTTIAVAPVGYTVTVSTPLYITYTQTGTAATAGAATIILGFVPNNDR